MHKLARTPHFGQLGPLFFGGQNDILRAWHKQVHTDDNNDDCNDNYDSNGGNFYENDDKNDQQTYKYYDFSAKMCKS